MTWTRTGMVEREARAATAVLKARAAGADPYETVFVGAGRRPGLVDPVERECPAWMLFDDQTIDDLTVPAAS